MITPTVGFSGETLAQLQALDIHQLIGETNYQTDSVSNLKNLPIIDYGTIEIPTGSYTTPALATVPHNLGYTPLFLAYTAFNFGGAGATYQVLPYFAPFTTIPVPTPIGITSRYDAYADSANLYLTWSFIGTTFIDNAIPFFYFIFNNPAVN